MSRLMSEPRAELIRIAARMVRLEGGCESGHKRGQWHMHEEPYHATGRALARLARADVDPRDHFISAERDAYNRGYLDGIDKATRDAANAGEYDRLARGESPGESRWRIERRHPMNEPEHPGWRDLSDRDLLSYAWSILASAERALPHGSVQRAEAATAVGQLGRRIGDHPAAAALASPSLDVAQSYLTPLVHLPARRIDDPDDIPRCVVCARWLTPDNEHHTGCPVAAYLAALTRGDTR